MNDPVMERLGSCAMATPTSMGCYSIPTLKGLPEVILRQRLDSAHRPARLLTPIYGSLRRSFSGSTWYLAQAGMKEGTLDGAFTLNSEARFNPRLQFAGARWKLERRLQAKKAGGFKFVQRFHDLLWSQHIDRLAETTILNNSQIFGPRFLKRFRSLGISPCFYIDGTLTEYFYGYGTVEDQTIGGDMVRKAIALEREGYAQASRLITMSRSTARHLVEEYNVAPERIAVVAPGANIDDEAVPAPSPHDGWVGREFTLGFVGLYPFRKGLDKLAEAVRLLRSRGEPIRLRVIGRCPEAIAAMDGVEFLGAIDKAEDTQRFVAALQTMDLGCQLSRVELLGIAILEFLRLGVPVIATAVGGVPDVLEAGGGLLVPGDVTVEQLAEELHVLMADHTRYRALRNAAIHRAEWASWRRAGREIDVILQNTRGVDGASSL